MMNNSRLGEVFGNRLYKLITGMIDGTLNTVEKSYLRGTTKLTDKELLALQRLRDEIRRNNPGLAREVYGGNPMHRNRLEFTELSNPSIDSTVLPHSGLQPEASKLQTILSKLKI